MIDAWGMITFGCGIAGWLLTGRDPNWLFVIGAGAGMYAMVIMMLVQGSGRLLTLVALSKFVNWKF